GGAEPGNPSPSINDNTSRPDQHGGSSEQPPGTAQQAARRYDFENLRPARMFVRV
ncbi:unnamed protein product, partial [Nesidiocoris tenuis]